MVSDQIAVEKFIVDTGAMYSCCNYWLINESLNERDLKNNECRKIGGLVEGDKVRFYRYPLRQFAVGNIDVGKQDIWITFDERVTDIVVGLDILKQVIMIINPYKHEIYFCKDWEDYNDHFALAAD